MAEPGMFDMLKQARSLQKQMSKIQKKIGKKKVSVSTGGGMAEVEITGKLVVTRVTIEPSLVAKGDVAFIQELVKSAVNGAITKAQDMMNDEMKQVAGGLDIPGMT